MTEDFEQYVYDSAADALRSVPDAERDDTYVVSFFVYDEEDDPRLPTLTVGTNTETQVRFASDPPADFEKPNPWWEPAGPGEARWNYAFWTQDRLAGIADTGIDPHGAALRERWIRNAGLWCDDPVDDDWDTFEELGARITVEFVLICVRTAQQLHRAGVVEEVFGRPQPIVIHELEYCDEIARQTAEANPPGLADAFVAWVNSL